ncbi:hypothetical protein GCK72_015172 [Caenorhabditis remanei]|uniref:SCP domain-containing protein n=1 Tax=Caenorhabditis remanei TaxID=31234 RepID=A0A6A5GWJ1_CAERE|nr:hypothetical protein GCK72_015172 [Caenorhabditis remanei]KAF1758712.1 hypothetical protein GCK72_015172 [Caenorhabditis remanei]
MKPVVVLLGIFLTSFFSVSIAKQLNKEEYLKAINEERRVYAKKARIPNMYKLEWDDFLATRAERGDCDFKSPSCRVALKDGNSEVERHAQDQMRYYFPYAKRSELIDSYGKYHMNGHEDMTPGQKKIGCAPVTIKQNENHQMTGYEMLEFQTRCILEPEGTGESWNMKLGDAGSKCAEGYKNDDGLCTPVEKSEKVSGGGSLENSQNGTATNSSGINGKTYGISLVFLLSVIHTMF